jgi:hypothetical protein
MAVMVTLGIPLGLSMAFAGLLLFLATKRRPLAMMLVVVGILLAAVSAVLWAMIVNSPM